MYGSGDVLLLGESKAMERVRMEVANAARTLAKVLITGETGVGKEVVARAIHMRSARASRPFVPVNCTGIPETLLASELFGHVRGSFTGAYSDRLGLLQRADQGSLFLDELGEMSIAMQALLLRFTETGEIQRVGGDATTVRADVRLITATNRDLRAQIAAGTFREDLYYRLNVIHLEIPPLRERREDVPLLLRHFLRKASEMHQLPCAELSAEAERRLTAYSWPGNVRELRNVAERLTLRSNGSPLKVDDLPEEIIGAAPDGPRSGAVATERPAEEVDVVVDRLWQQLMDGGDFWTVVQQPFRNHQITKRELAAVIHRGLHETHGSYRALVTLFNLAPHEYKRFHAFLYQQNCNLPVGPYRRSLGNRTAKAQLSDRERPALRRALPA